MLNFNNLTSVGKIWVTRQLVYLALGYLIVAGIGGTISQTVSLVLAAAGGTVAFVKRDEFEVRKWVMRAFIVIDVIIVVALALAILGRGRRL